MKRLVALLTAAAAFLLPHRISHAEPEPPAAEFRCLAVGMDRFVNEENTAPCSANNAETMAGLFGDCLPEGTKIIRRVNGPAGRAEMEA